MGLFLLLTGENVAKIGKTKTKQKNPKTGSLKKLLFISYGTWELLSLLFFLGPIVQLYSFCGVHSIFLINSIPL